MEKVQNLKSSNNVCWNTAELLDLLLLRLFKDAVLEQGAEEYIWA
jgi:hypothetical protein